MTTPFALLLSLALPSIVIAREFKDLNPILDHYLQESGLPSLAAAKVVGDKIEAIGAVGIRKTGDPTTVTPDDKYHIGSCTKPMTATLTAALIEDGLLAWDTTIEAVLGRSVRNMDPGFRNVTVEQLLTHTGGFSEDPPNAAWRKAWKNQGKISAVDQRLEFVSSVLKEEPAYAPGEKSEYSNQGYAVLGVMLETLAKKPWEELMRERIFKPLGMDSAGFRAPADAKRLDHPSGHLNGKPVPPEPAGDNPAAIAPAGAVHLSIGDWAKFARFHLLRKPGKVLEKPESFDKLHSTLPNSSPHGVGGWVQLDRKNIGGPCIQMAGSNTQWFALLWIIPGLDTAVVVATNSAQDNAFETCDGVVGALLR
jgi:CubicO group peptidase (beta-lactamase class C family)